MAIRCGPILRSDSVSLDFRLCDGSSCSHSPDPSPLFSLLLSQALEYVCEGVVFLLDLSSAGVLFISRM